MSAFGKNIDNVLKFIYVWGIFMADALEEISKFISCVLRHKPESIGLLLDVEGWADIGDLIRCAEIAGKNFNYEMISVIVSSSDKKRFEISPDGANIRAIQGHSSELVKRQYSELQPPDFLYHGTATRFLESIWKEGLVAGPRHHVHLTENEGLAHDVGRRYGKSVILRISSYEMFVNGYKFFKAENDVWLTFFVPPEFIGALD